MSGTGKELLTAIVLHYNNGDMIYETLQSILSQTYPRIEIIVCDDCSREFPKEGIESWLNDNKGSNIENFTVHRNEANVGTVKNMEVALSLSHGTIITQIAADDAYYSDTVFEMFADELERLGPDAKLVTGQSAMMDLKLEKKLYDFVSDTSKELIKNCSTEELFEKVACRCFLPAVNFWRRELIETLGPFSDRYRLIEDWTKSLRMLRMGIRVYYLDEYLLKHRDGGVSHGNKKGVSRTYMYYVNDYIQAYRNEVFPYMENFSNESVESTVSNYSWWMSVLNAEPEEDKLARKKQNKIVTKVLKKVLKYTINILRSIYDTISKK